MVSFLLFFCVCVCVKTRKHQTAASHIGTTNNMTTAHRPTWKAAVGRANEGGWTAGGALSTQKSALDAPAQLSLKSRTQPIDRKKALKESLLALEQAEEQQQQQTSKMTTTTAKQFQPNSKQSRLESGVTTRDVSRKNSLSSTTSHPRLLKQTAEEDEGRGQGDEVDDKVRAKSDQDGHDPNEEDEEESDLDADDDDDDDEDDGDDDDEEALQAELAKIRAEREEVRRQEVEKEEAAQEEAALLGNPLLVEGVVGAGGGGRKRRRRQWNDDVVFRNQAKGQPKPKKRFINDTVRNDFHKRFLNKFIR